MSIQHLKMLDLFAGAGGLSEGLSEAGFHSLFASEIVPVYAQTYQHNHPNAILHTADIRELDANEVRKQLNLEREELCRSGLYFVCPKPVCDRVLERLGGKGKLPQFPTQPVAIHFVAYDYAPDIPVEDGKIRPLGIIEECCTTVYKVQEAFSAVDLSEQNVYRDAIRQSLHD